MSYLGRSAKLSLKAQEKVSFLATAGQTVKTGLSYVPSFVEVYVNGVLLTDTTDFTATNGNSITFTVALLLNDEVTVISLKTFTVADHYSKTEADTLLAAKSPLASPSFTGNVGIGTSSSPANKLHIETDTVNAGSGEVAIRMDVPAAYVSARNEIRSGVTSGTNPYMAFAVRETASPNATVERMRITSDGRGLSDFTAKAWLQFKQVGTQEIRDSHNVSSITDLGVGFTRINFANNLANINYSAVDSYTVQSNISNISSNVTDYLVSSYTIAHRENGSLIDTSRISSTVFGS